MQRDLNRQTKNKYNLCYKLGSLRDLFPDNIK